VVQARQSRSDGRCSCLFWMSGVSGEENQQQQQQQQQQQRQ
jgi:hypothetical protein